MPNQEEINQRESRQTGLNVKQQETSQAAAYSGTTTQTAAPAQQTAAPVQQQQSVPPATQPPVKQPIQPIMGGQTANPLTENTNGAITSAGIGQGEAQLPAQRLTTSPISAGATGANPNENSAGGVAAASGEGFNINGIQMNRETWEGSLNFLGNTVALPKSKSAWEGENINFGNIAIPNGTSGRFSFLNARVESIIFNRNTGFKSAAITASSISMGRGMKMLVGEPLKASLQKGENAYTLSIPKLTLNGLATPEIAEFQQIVLKMASDGTLIEGNGLSIDTSKFKDLKLDSNGIFVKAANPEIPTKFVDLKLSWEEMQGASKQSQNPPTKFLGDLKKGEKQPIESEKLSENTAVQGLLTQMQAAYGVDMSGVEIIKNSSEADKQDAVGVSIGNEIHLAKGEFTQSNPKAMGLLAHELTHFVQKEQDRVSADAIFKGQAVNTDPQLEQEADLVAEKFLAQAPLPTLATAKAENPTDEVAQLKPKKPFAEWILLDEQNNYQLYEIDNEYVVCDMQTFELWSIHKLQFNGRFDRNDILLGWQMLTPTEINELQIPLNNLPRKPKTKVPPAPPVTNPKQEEQKKSPFVWGNGATTPTTSELPSNLYADLHLYTDKKSLTKREQDRTISWNDFIAEVISLENSLTPEKRHNTRFVITQLRKLYYNSGQWNTWVIPNTGHIEQEVQNANLTNHPNIEMLNGNIMDFGHIFAGLDAGNHDIGEGVGMAWLGVSKNIDMATWIGDLASIPAEGYFQPNDIQRLIDENCSPQDLLADIDAVGIDFLHKNESYSLVSDLLQAHYGEQPKYTQRDRIIAFAQATQLGAFDGTNFSAENTWLAQYKSEISDAVTLLVGKKQGLLGKGVTSMNFWNETFSESTAEYFLIKLLNLIKKYV